MVVNDDKQGLVYFKRKSFAMAHECFALALRAATRESAADLTNVALAMYKHVVTEDHAAREERHAEQQQPQPGGKAAAKGGGVPRAGTMVKGSQKALSEQEAGDEDSDVDWDMATLEDKPDVDAGWAHAALNPRNESHDVTDPAQRAVLMKAVEYLNRAQAMLQEKERAQAQRAGGAGQGLAAPPPRTFDAAGAEKILGARVDGWVVLRG